MLQFQEVYGIKENKKIKEIARDTLLELNPKLLETNLIRIGEIVESNYPNFSISDKYKLKIKMAKFVSASTRLFKGKEDIYCSMLDFTILTEKDIYTGMKVIGPNGKSMIDWDLMKKESELVKEQERKAK